LYDITRRQFFGQMAGITKQCFPVAKRAYNYVAGPDFRHASTRQLECIVGSLAIENLDSHEHAFLAGNFRTDLELALQGAILRHRSDLVGDYGFHFVVSTLF
jgi:hypothetical protein